MRPARGKPASSGRPGQETDVRPLRQRPHGLDRANLKSPLARARSDGQSWPSRGCANGSSGVSKGARLPKSKTRCPTQRGAGASATPIFAPEGSGSLRVFCERVTDVAAHLAVRQPRQLEVMVPHGGQMDVPYRAASPKNSSHRAPGSSARRRSTHCCGRLKLALAGWNDNTPRSNDALDEADR